MHDHGDEVAALDALLSTLGDDAWLKATPADGWDVRDSVAHLAVGDEMALECVVMDHVPVDMQRGMDAVTSGSQEAMAQFEQELVERGRILSGSDVATWWRAGNVALRDSWSEMDPSRRLPWGPNVLSAASFVTARLMETWAHGLDCFDGVGAAPTDTDRLRHIAHLGIRAMPYAFMVAGLPSPGPVLLVLESPSGDEWRLGPDDAPNVIHGTAGDFCRAAVRRDRRNERSRLKGTGPDAAAIIEHVRAYL